MDDSYNKNGVASWSSGKVPYLLTTGPLIAKAYWRLLQAYLEDCERNTVFDEPSEVVYVVELGAGTGRLAWNFMSYYKRFPSRQKIVYVLSDVIKDNIDFWSGHKYLNALAKEGLIDYAHYDVLRDTEINLLVSKKKIAPGTAKAPTVFLANYLFDVLPQDLFCVSSSETFEESVMPVGDDPGINWDSPDLLSRLWFAVDRKSIDSTNYYEDDFLNAVLRKAADFYRSCLSDEEDPVRFLFPKAPLVALKNLHNLTDGNMMLLVAERPGGIRQDSENEEEEKEGSEVPGLSDNPSPETRLRRKQKVSVEGKKEAICPANLLSMGVHGSTFSLPVDMNILSIAASHSGGELLRADPVPVGLEVCAFLFTQGEPLSLREEFYMSVAEQSPEELFLVLYQLRHHKKELSLADLVIAIRASGYDAHFLFQVYDRLQELLTQEPPDKTDEVARVLLEVDSRHFPMDIFVNNALRELPKTDSSGITDTQDIEPGGVVPATDFDCADKTDISDDKDAKKSVDLASLMATLLASVGEIDAALELLYRHRERRGPRPAETFNMAVCLFLQGKTDPAAERLKEVLSLDPAHKKAQQFLKQIRDLQ